MNKKLIFLLLSLLTMTACHEKDEPNVDVFFQNLNPCPVSGIYEGVISNMLLTDKSSPGVGVWCEITKAPDDAYDKGAPVSRCNVYFKRSDFPNSRLESGTEVQFRIIKYGSFPSDFPYNYIFLWDRAYFICIVEPVK